jgi:hypothetical protein
MWGLYERYIVGLRALRRFDTVLDWFLGWFLWQYAVLLCIYCFMRGSGVRITLASAGGSACIAITPLVRLQQVNKVLIDWLIDKDLSVDIRLNGQVNLIPGWGLLVGRQVLSCSIELYLFLNNILEFHVAILDGKIILQGKCAMDSESEGWPMWSVIELVRTIDSSRFSAKQEAGMILPLIACFPNTVCILQRSCSTCRACG